MSQSCFPLAVKMAGKRCVLRLIVVGIIRYTCSTMPLTAMALHKKAFVHEAFIAWFVVRTSEKPILNDLNPSSTALAAEMCSSVWLRSQRAFNSIWIEATIDARCSSVIRRVCYSVTLFVFLIFARHFKPCEKTPAKVLRHLNSFPSFILLFCCGGRWSWMNI